MCHNFLLTRKSVNLTSYYSLFCRMQIYNISYETTKKIGIKRAKIGWGFSLSLSLSLFSRCFFHSSQNLYYYFVALAYQWWWWRWLWEWVTSCNFQQYTNMYRYQARESESSGWCEKGYSCWKVSSKCRINVTQLLSLPDCPPFSVSNVIYSECGNVRESEIDRDWDRKSNKRRKRVMFAQSSMLKDVYQSCTHIACIYKLDGIYFHVPVV